MLRAIFALFAFGLNACTTTQSSNILDGYAFNLDEDPRLGEELHSACSVRTIRGFSMYSDNMIVMEISSRKSILVEVYGTCRNLDSAMQIAIDPNVSCLSRGDRLIVSSSLFAASSSPFDTETCRVKSIRSWGIEQGKPKNTSKVKSVRMVDEAT